MSNLNKIFGEFNEKITLTKAKREDLKTSRNALRDDIRNWFKDSNQTQPKFCWQGSYSMKTIINPIGDEEYDLDDGIYLQDFEESKSEDWIAPSTAHAWIKSAVVDRTERDITDKNTCVRVRYAAGYHIDLPIYIVQDDVAYLAHKSEGWVESDPKAFREWFLDEIKKDEKGEQLRRIVKYLKAWKDYKNIDLKGIEITILATNNFEKYADRDDKCLRNTLDNIIATLDVNFECIKPVEPGEDLFENKSDSAKDSIISDLESLSETLDSAIKEKNEKEATIKMRKFFGDRFPLGEDMEDFAETKMPGVLKHDGRSA